MKVSDVMLPVGQTEAQMERLQVVPLPKTPDLAHSIVAVAHPVRRSQQDGATAAAAAEQQWLLSAPVAGFVFV